MYPLTGSIFIFISSVAWALSHTLAIKNPGRLELVARVIGFLSVILVFVTSGFLPGLISLPIIFIASLTGSLIARYLRNKNHLS
jgi:hypothetical protein